MIVRQGTESVMVGVAGRVSVVTKLVVSRHWNGYGYLLSARKVAVSVTVEIDGKVTHLQLSGPEADGRS